MQLDRHDHAILAALVRDGRLSVVALAEAVGLSPTAVQRRMRRLETAGVLTGYGARVDMKALGFGVRAFVRVSIERQSDAQARAFERAVEAERAVVACFVMTGDLDFLLDVAARDLDDFADFTMRRLLRMPGVRDVRSSLVLEVVKDSPAALVA